MPSFFWRVKRQSLPVAVAVAIPAAVVVPDPPARELRYAATTFVELGPATSEFVA
jgi:hypothetical protein